MAQTGKPLAGEVVEELELLRALAQSPGWARYSNRLRRRVQSSDKAKADALRSGQATDAMILQGKVDGMAYALDYLPQLIDDLEQSVKASAVTPYP